MKFWNWGPTTIWHNIQYNSKSLHPIVNWIFDIGQPSIYRRCSDINILYVQYTIVTIHIYLCTNLGIHFLNFPILPYLMLTTTTKFYDDQILFQGPNPSGPPFIWVKIETVDSFRKGINPFEKSNF